MLKEKIFYKEGLPVSVTTANIQEYPIHFHDDIEVAYVLEGTIILKNGYYTYTLKPGDVFILNDREIHSFTGSDGDNTVMMMQLDMSFFSKYYENFKNSFFVTDMEDEDESMDVLRKILSRIMMQTIEKGLNYEQNIIETTHNLIGLLLSDFQYFAMEDGRFVNEAKNKGNKILAGRMNRITDYLYENYTRRLTLNEVAEKEHLSIFYLSHVIKTATGLSFQELLSFIRVEESEKLVLGTNKKIGTIADETGFSAVRYYIKYFTKWFGMHPDEYRKLYTGKVSSREILAKYTLTSPALIKGLVRKEQLDVYHDFENDDPKTSVIVDVDMNEYNEYINLDECRIKNLLKSENMKPAANLYKIFKDLNEEILLMGHNCIVSKKNIRGAKNYVGLSILIYNLNEDVEKIVQGKLSLENISEKLPELANKEETLIRISGLTGTFMISKIKFTKQNVISAYDFKIANHDKEDLRATALKKFGSNPVVTESTIRVTDNLTVQSNLEGLSGELILIDLL